MSVKYYLDEAGLAKLIENIKLELNHKANVSDIPPIEELTSLVDKVAESYKFKGSVSDLSLVQPEVNDVYKLESTGENMLWTGEAWEPFGAAADLSSYLREDEIEPISISDLHKIFYNTASGVVNNINGIMEMVNNDFSEITITLNNDIDDFSTIAIPQGKTVTLDLDNKAIEGTTLFNVNGGNLTLKNGSITSSSDSVAVSNGGSLILNNVSISSGHNGVSVKNNGTVTMNSGEITSQEAGIAAFKDSNVIMNGGTITGIDNCPIMGNGSKAGAANDGTNMNFTMNGGKLIAHISTPGYIACGAYMPNSGTFTMNGGEIISDGAGLVMRGGTVNLNGGSIVANGASGARGKVGDSRVVVGPYAVTYDANSAYPAVDTMQLTIGKDMILSGTDGDIDYLIDSGYTKNVIDNR